MKRKLVTVLLLIVCAVSFAGLINVNATSLEEATVKNVTSSTNYLGGYGASTVIHFGIPSGLAAWTSLEKTNFSWKDKDGNQVPIGLLDVQGNNLLLNRCDARQGIVGDIISIEQGFVFGGKEVKKTVSYKYVTEGYPWVLQSENGTANIEDFAENTDGISINFGETSGFDDFISIPKTNITWKDKDGQAVTVEALEAKGNNVVINRAKTRKSQLGDIITIETGFVFANKEIKETLSYKYEHEGYSWVLQMERAAANIINVVVDVNYGTWAGNVISINFGESSGSGGFISLPKNKFSWKDKDGVAVNVGLLETQGNYVVVNRAQTRKGEVGDVITFEAGFIFGRKEIKETVSYKYITEGEAWVLQKERAAVTIQEARVEVNYAGWAGNLILVDFGVSSGSTDFITIPKNYISWKDKDGNAVAIEYFETQANYVVINRSKTRKGEVGDVITFEKGFIFGDKEIKETVSYKYEHEGYAWVLQLEQRAAVIIKDVKAIENYGGWAGKVISVDFGVSSGTSNFISLPILNFSWKDKNGQAVNASLLETQGTNVLINRAQTRQGEIGDIITFEKGFIFGRTIIEETVSYKYATVGETWVLQKERAAATIKDVRIIENYGSWAGNVIAVNFGETSGSDEFITIPKNYISWKDKDGQAVNIGLLETQGNYVVINRAQTRKGEIGDIITLEAGFIFGEKEIKETVSYRYLKQGATWALLVEGEKEEGIIRNINTSSDYEENGACTVVDFGIPSGLANFTTVDKAKLTWKDSSGNNVIIDLLEAYGYGLLLNRGKTRLAEIGDTLTFEEGFILGDKVIKQTISYKYIKANEEWERVYKPLSVAPNDSEGTFGYDIWYLTDWSGPGIKVNFGSSTAAGFVTWFNAGVDYLVYTNAYGETIPLYDCTNIGDAHFIMRIGSVVNNFIPAMVGDKITFKKGFKLHDDEAILEDITFIVTNKKNGSVLALYNEDMLATTFEITNPDTNKDLSIGATFQMKWSIEEGKYGTPYFTSSDITKATVTKGGLIVPLTVGKVTITGHLGNVTKDFELNIVEVSPIKEIELTNAYKYWVEKDGTVTIPNLLARVLFENGLYSLEFALEKGVNFTYDAIDTSTVGTKAIELTIDYDSKKYKAYYYVEVYDFYDQEITEIETVHWLYYWMFAKLPNTSTNKGNITNTGALNGVLEYLVYKRADGTEIPISGFYQLNENFCVMPNFGAGVVLDAQNYKDYYLAGDIITFKAGLCIYKWTGEYETNASGDTVFSPGTGRYIVEGMIPKTVEFRYDGDTWRLYEEYTDITVPTTVELKIGENKMSGVLRDPISGTTGTITYSSSNTSVVTVSDRGILNAKAEGSAIITVVIDGGKAGRIEKTFTVNVVDYITGIEFTPDKIDIKNGADIDLSTVTAVLKYKSGKTSEKIDLSNAKISGFDAKTASEQIVVIKATVDGIEYSGKLIVNVARSGCSGGCSKNINAGISIIFVVGVASLLFMRKKKTN